MKKSKSVLTPLFLFVMVVCGCSKEFNSSSFEGTWQVTNMTADMPTLSPAIIKSGEELAMSTTYLFNADGTSLEKSSYYPEGIQGVWTFVEDSLILRINSTDEAIPSTAEHVVTFINKRKMEWNHDASELGNFTMTLIKKR